MEDATPAENQEAFELIRQHTVTPLAVGEVFNSIWDCKHLHREPARSITSARPSCTAAASRICAASRISRRCIGVRTGFHGATDLSPVCMGAALHFDTWVPNFGIQEYMKHAPRPTRCFRTTTRSGKAASICGESPGHGVTIDEKLAREVSLLAEAAGRIASSKTARCGTGVDAPISPRKRQEGPPFRRLARKWECPIP